MNAFTDEDRQGLTLLSSFVMINDDEVVKCHTASLGSQKGSVNVLESSL